jgi:peptide/nickel transport system permease protein
VLGRILGVIPVLIGASILVFVSMRILPGDPVTVLAEGSPLTEEQREVLIERYDLDEPIATQYVNWVSGAITGDFGISLKSNRPVSDIIGEAIGPTALLLAGGFAFSLAVSVPLGILAGIREGTRSDHAVVMLTMLLFSVPLFISCVLAIYFFALKLGWFPAFGLPFDEGLGSLVRHLVLPWVTLGLALIAVQAATLRAGMIDALQQEHVVMAEGRGLPRRQVIRRHVLRSALVPMVTLLGLQMSYMVVGSVFVDLIFGLGGLGTVLVNAVKVRDLPVVQAVVMIVSFTFIVANLGVDLVSSRLDPRYEVR